MYSLIRKALFCLPAETSHELTLDWLGATDRLGLTKWLYNRPSRPVSVMGLHFPNPVGLAAGLDKNGDYLNALGRLGFGFVEIGTITPRPQPGNPQPRLFRLPEHNAIINRMGFNNKGVDYLVEQVKKRDYSGVLGINIGKNKLTPERRALDDYRQCLVAVYPYADYITVNISSPNTPGLRDLQFGEALIELLEGLKACQNEQAQRTQRYVPLAVKIAPDMDDLALDKLVTTLVDTEVDGVIATNTTLSRSGVENASLANESGGLSGAPLRQASTEMIAKLSERLQGQLPIIGVGGILSGRDAQQKFSAGASLVQVYTGLIYRGPQLIKECLAD